MTARTKLLATSMSHATTRVMIHDPQPYRYRTDWTKAREKAMQHACQYSTWRKRRESPIGVIWEARLFVRHSFNVALLPRVEVRSVGATDNGCSCNSPLTVLDPNRETTVLHF